MIPGLHRSVWVILLGASLLLSLAMGMRQSMGLFLPPVTKAFGLAAAEFTLAIAIQNMVWGLSQPFVGALADRLGLRPVMLAGGVLYALGLALMHQFPSAIGLLWGPGVLIASRFPVPLLCLACRLSQKRFRLLSAVLPSALCQLLDRLGLCLLHRWRNGCSTLMACLLHYLALGSYAC